MSARRASKDQLLQTLDKFREAIFGDPGRLDRDVWLDLNHSIRVIEGLRARRLDILEETLLQRIEKMAGHPPMPDLPEPVAPDETSAVEAEAEAAPVIRREPAASRPPAAAPRKEALPEAVLRPLNPPAEVPAEDDANAAAPAPAPTPAPEPQPLPETAPASEPASESASDGQ